MDFASGVAAAYNKKWAYNNTFSVQFIFAKYLKTKIGWTSADEKGLDIHIKGVSTPQFTNQAIETYIGDRWRVHNGRNELWKFTITFKDHNQLSLYRKFINTYNAQKIQYFDDIRMTVILLKDADYVSQADSILFTFNDVMIDSVGQVQFSNESDTQIVEFDVEFKCLSPVIGAPT